MKMDDIDDMKEEYTSEELGTGRRGKYLERYRSSKNIVVIDPDVAKVFPNAKAVNDALRDLIQKET